jgi:hypothetical protein
MKDYQLKQRNLRASHTLGWSGTGTPQDRDEVFFFGSQREPIEGLGMPIDYSKFNNIDVSDDDDDDVQKKLPPKKVCLSHVKVVLSFSC